MIKISNNKFSISIDTYYTELNKAIQQTYKLAKKARKKGFDPSLDVEIPIAKDIADRVEGLIGPSGVGKRIRELERTDFSREQVAFRIAQEIAESKFITGDEEELAEQAIRTSLAIITESITAAPLEGIAKVKIKENFDGTKYLAVYYAGPIRSAGGTAAGMSVLLADHVRQVLQLDKYKPSEREVERMLEEIDLYNKIMHLQLPTTKNEQRFAAQHLTVEISGEPTESEEVSGNRDLERVETNRLRGGACLVFNDGIVGRVKKLQKRVQRNRLKGWEWFSELIKIHAETNLTKDEDEVNNKSNSDNEDDLFVKPDLGYIQDVIGGRPVFSHPSEIGGFRIRYGRSRTTGLASMGVHPALMALTDDFLVCGTHVRTERPGKGAIVMPVNSLHPPIVKLSNNNVIKVNSYSEAKNIRSKVESILFLGDMLYGVGEFNQFNHDLIPSGYCEEWWVQELEKRLMDLSLTEKRNLFKDKFARIKDFIKNPHIDIPTPNEALAISYILDIPLHPEYTYHWNNISVESFFELREYIGKTIKKDEDYLIIPYDDKIKNILENIFIPHRVLNDNIYFDKHSKPFLISIGYENDKLLPITKTKGTTLTTINSIHEIKLRDKCPSYTGARMGRPEKAKDRRMKPPIHLLFPITSAGGRLRDLFTASENNTVKIDLVNRTCPKCEKPTHNILCNDCKVETIIVYYCKRCKQKTDKKICPDCKMETLGYTQTNFPLNDAVRSAKIKAGGPYPKIVKSVKKLMNKNRIPEHILKGILRSRHEVYVYRDGTARFDATDAVLTHFKPNEIGVSIDQLRKLGYDVDLNGEPLKSTDQILELKVQDIVINEKGAEYLLKVSRFIDDLLEKLYGLPKFYNAKKETDLIGHIVIGLAPHTSAGIVGRIIGFTKAKVILAHPYWHAAKRRNCLAGEEEIQIWDTKNKKLFFKPIAEIVNKIIEKGTKQDIVDDYGTLEVENPYSHWRVISIDPETKNPLFQPIKHWIKGYSNYWIKITTKTGRTIKMTPNHNAMIWKTNSNSLEKKKAYNIKKDDLIPVFSKLSLPQTEHSPIINILYELSKKLPKTKKFTEFKHQVRLRNASSWIQNKLRDFSIDNFSNTSKKYSRLPTKIKQYFLNILPEKPTKNPLTSNWYNSIPLSHLEILEKRGLFKWNEIPKEAVLAMARDDHTVSPYLPQNLALMRFLGYLISAGYIRDEKTCCQTNISVDNEDLRQHIRYLIENLFHSLPYHSKDNNQLIHTGKIHAYLFAYAWNIGSNSYSKRIPNFIFNLPDDFKFAFLSAYIDGDGSIGSKNDVISMYSVSKELLNDLGILLKTLGYFYGIRKKSPPAHFGKKILQRYEELEKEPKLSVVHKIAIRGVDLDILRFLNFKHPTKIRNAKKMMEEVFNENQPVRTISGKYYELKEEGNIFLDGIAKIETIKNQAPSYCLEVETNHTNKLLHNFSLNHAITMNCDGDEDSILLALDAFLNFSKSFLPEVRGGMMDAPLILVSTINPFEVDDESHNVDTSFKYPLSFYEATLSGGSAKKVLPFIDIVNHRLDSFAAYEGFGYSHETSSIFVGESSTNYTRLGSMEEKVEAQLKVAKKIRAVDVDDVATRVIFKQFIPDLLGNLRRFGSQKIRCTNCNTTFRRIPLAGTCPSCKKDKLNLTVYEKSVTKYWAIVNYLIENYSVSEYLRSRVAIIKHNFETLFGDQATILDESQPKRKNSVVLSDFLLKEN